MSILEWRGGFPVVFEGTVDDTGEVTDARGRTIPAGTSIRLGAHQVQLEEDGRKGPITSKWVRICNGSTVANETIRVYFSQDHFDDDVHGATLKASNTKTAVWEGPAEVQEIWLRSTNGTPAFDITAFNRRG